MFKQKNIFIFFTLFFIGSISNVFSKESYKINDKRQRERIELNEIDIGSLFKENLESIVKSLPEKFTKNEENFFNTLDKKYHSLEPYFKYVYFYQLSVTKEEILKRFNEYRVFIKEKDANNIDEIFLKKYNLYLKYNKILDKLLHCYQEINFLDNSDSTDEEKRKQLLSDYNFMYSNDPDNDFLYNLKKIDDKFSLIKIKNDIKYYKIWHICFKNEFTKTLEWLSNEKKYIFFRYNSSSIEFYNHIYFHTIDKHSWELNFNIFIKNNENYSFFLKLLGCDDPKKHSKFLLHEAVRDSNSELVKSLLQAGCNPNQKELNGVYPIFQAIANLDVETVSILLEHPVDLNVHLFDCPDNFNDGNALLSLAITSLFSLSADRNYVFKDFKYGVIFEIEFRSVPFFNVYTINVNEDDIYVRELRALKIITLLLDKGIRLKKGTEQFTAKTWASYMWIKAAFYQDQKTLEHLHAISLKDKSFNFDTYHFRNYELSDKWKNIPFANGFCSPLLIAVWQNNLEIVKLLLNQNNHFNRPEALHAAILMEHDMIVEKLLKNNHIRMKWINKALPCYKIIDGFEFDRATPLMLSLFKKNKKIEELLLQNGANPELKIDDMNAAEFAEFFLN